MNIFHLLNDMPHAATGKCVNLIPVRVTLKFCSTLEKFSMKLIRT